ncbi:hypothetical protein BGZ79_008927 [Entomortierella chlamydospora]|nr:hypothetical protein BGZ79_008927 [Entomortierella chlamydospora]
MRKNTPRSASMVFTEQWSMPLVLASVQWARYKTIEQGTIGLVTRFGRYYKTVDPGLIKLNPYTETVQKVDMRVQISNIDHQVIMTKDNVNVHIDSIIYWHVIDPYQALYGVSNVRTALIERTKTTLRQVLGAKLLQEIIENREQLAHEIQTIIDIPAHAWGVTVESILIKDIQFSKSLQESLSSAAQAKRLAESKVIHAQSEVDSAKLMRQAAEFLNTPAAMQIRYLESLALMAHHGGQKTIFMPTTDDARTHFHGDATAGSTAPLPSVSLGGPSGQQVLSYQHTDLTLSLKTPARAARDIYNMVSRGLGQRIPDAALKALQQQSALALVTKGAGREGAEHDGEGGEDDDEEEDGEDGENDEEEESHEGENVAAAPGSAPQETTGEKKEEVVKQEL